MRKFFWIFQAFWLSFLSAATIFSAPPAQRLETRTFDYRTGDTLVIQNDYGRVRVQAWDNPQVEARIRTVAVDDSNLENVSILAQRAADRIFIQAYFYGYQSESVYVDVQTPPGINVVIWGANPAVELNGLAGYTRVHSLTGLVTAENLMGSASLASETGDLLYRSSIQPRGDVRLESQRGNIDCRIQDDLNLRGWLRAGRTLFWNKEVELSQGSLEKQIGVGGPLLYANSGGGDVSFLVDEAMRSQVAVAGDLPVEPEPQSAPSDDSEWKPVDYEQSSTPSDQPTTTSPGHNSPEADFPPPQGGSSETPYALKVNVEWIYLNVSVRDSYNNRAIPNLNKQDFLVYEDGVEQRVDKFASTEAPFNLLLLLDVSGSTREYMDLIREASIEFTRQIRPSDRIGVATFNSESRLIQDFTNDRTRVERAIRGIRSGGGTAFYDALDRSIQDYMRGLEGRKAIVVFSDGVDNQLTGDYSHGSRTTFRDLYRQIQEIDTLIYTIFLDTEDQFGRNAGRNRGNVGGVLIDIIRGRTPPTRRGGGGWGRDPVYEEAQRELEQIAEQTGGRMYAPNSIYDLEHVYTEIADDLRMQYTLGYHSSNPSQDGRWRSVEVELSNRRDAVVRARKGYYAGRP